jgi:peptide-methionine (R)-S-oxide reductase
MPSPHPTSPTRRLFLASAGALPVAALASPQDGEAATTGGDDFKYSVTRSDAEWRARLTPLEYEIMREGRTEPRHTSLNAFEERPGTYHCKGCDLPSFDAEWKVSHFDIGWAFFSQARPNAILTGIDQNFSPMADSEPKATIECHCRRCGSHIGHILEVRDKVLHCLNGSALEFKPS